MIWSDVRVLLTARSLLVALIVALSGVVLSQTPAHACSCVITTVQQQTDRADVVFSGVLVDATTSSDGKQERTSTLYEIEADNLYKGDLTEDTVQVGSSNKSCGLGDLTPQRRYLFFAVEKDGELRIDQCSGTDRATRVLTAKVEKVLGPGTDLTPREKPNPVVVEFTKVADAEPETLTRIAAPGAALVLLGLLGLVVVRRATKRD